MTIFGKMKYTRSISSVSIPYSAEIYLELYCSGYMFHILSFEIHAKYKTYRSHDQNKTF